MNAPVHVAEVDDRRFAAAAELLRMLADRTRLALLHCLTDGEVDVSTLVEAVSASRTSVSQHLAQLRMAGLVTSRRDGQRVLYCLSQPRLQPLIDEALRVVDR